MTPNSKLSIYMVTGRPKSKQGNTTKTNLNIEKEMFMYTHYAIFFSCLQTLIVNLPPNSIWLMTHTSHTRDLLIHYRTLAVLIKGMYLQMKPKYMKQCNRVYLYIDTHTHTRARTHVHMHTHVRTHAHAHTHLHFKCAIVYNYSNIDVMQICIRIMYTL